MNDMNYQGQNTNDTQTQPMGTQTQDQQTPHPQQNMKIDDKAVAKMVAETLMSMAGITANKVEITDAMTREAFDSSRNNNRRPLH